MNIVSSLISIIRPTAGYCFVLGVSSFMLIACGENSGKIDNNDRKQVLDTIAREVIVPAFQDLKNQTDSLYTLVKYFSEHPSQTSLVAARGQWNETAFAWKRASTYTFGPIEDNFLTGGIFYASVHFPNIEKSIQTPGVIDNTYINSLGSSLKGLKAIEYLLYKDTDPETTLSEFLASSPRRSYLLALTNNLNEQVEKVVNLWTEGETPFLDTFTSATGRELNSSLSILVNKCIQQINLIRDERLGVPMGMRSGEPPRSDLVEGRLNNTSTELLKNEILSVQMCFGDEDTGGINTLLDQLGATYEGGALSQKIIDQFALIYESAKAIQVPLEEAIESDSKGVRKLYDELKKLQILVEVDVVNHLGIILTFSDNDGD